MKQVAPLTAIQMLDLASYQDKLNQLMTKTNFGTTDWKEKHFCWGLAIEDECMEIANWMGWKWWKGVDKYQIGVTPENLAQIKIELVDLLHFGLSRWFQFDQPYSDMEDEGYGKFIPGISPWAALWKLRRHAVKNSGLHWGAWYSLCCVCEFEAQEIWEVYVSKYALNIFRQAHGYGDGSYPKEWDVLTHGLQEDNYYLEVAIKDCKVKGIPITAESITEELEYWFDQRVDK